MSYYKGKFNSQLLVVAIFEPLVAEVNNFLILFISLHCRVLGRLHFM